jgi:hypothetical protein
VEPSNRFANAGRSTSTRVGAPRTVWGGQSADWSSDPTYQYWAERKVDPSVARYLALRASRERELMAEMNRVGGPSPMPGTGLSPALYRRQQQDHQTAQQRREGVEVAASSGLEIAAATQGLVDPTSAALMIGARVAINLIDPSGALGL